MLPPAKPDELHYCKSMIFVDRPKPPLQVYIKIMIFVCYDSMLVVPKILSIETSKGLSW